MPSYSDYEYDFNDNDYDSDFTNDSLEEEYDDYGDTDEDVYEDPEDLFYKDDEQTYTQWVFLSVGDTKLRVFNTGAIQYPDSIFNVTYGTPVPGTPYRTVCIKVAPNDYQNFYVHQLVWNAFHGKVPNGWVVGHKDRTTDFDSSYCYNNHIDNLDIYMDIVSEMV